MKAIERLASSFPDARFELDAERVRVTHARSLEGAKLRAHWHAAVLGEIAFARGQPLRERVHARLFGR